MEMTNSNLILEVSSPLSDEAAQNRGNAPRLATLNGKTICEVWATGKYGAEVTFPAIRKILREQYPEVEIVPYTEFAIGEPNPNQRWAPLDKVAEILRSKGCDAVLLGNGG